MNILVLNRSEKYHTTPSLLNAGKKYGYWMVVLNQALFSPLASNIDAGYYRVYNLLPLNSY